MRVAIVSQRPCGLKSRSTRGRLCVRAAEGFKKRDEDKTAAEALRRSLAKISKQRGRVPTATNLVFGGNTSESNWRELDKKVNTYPSQRSFTAIGSGGSDFADSIVSAVERQLGPVHLECIGQRESSNGKYLSVTVGPVWVQNADQVVSVYANMKQDKRVKWCM